MNLGDDWSTSEDITRALIRALFDCVNDAAAECLAEMEREREAVEQAAAAQIPQLIRRQTYVRREHDVAHQRLFDNYFAEQPRREDGISRPGLTPLQKCTVAPRQLAYGTTTDMFDEYLHVAEKAGRNCLKNFCRGIVEAYSNTYLQRPTAEDCQTLMKMHETVQSFPGMLRSIDCMHWEWKNCPTAWRGQFTSGYKGSHPTMILEAVADHRLWIWHAYFCVAGSNNDINILNSSNLFADQCRGRGPAIEFTTNGRQCHMRYYLADGIYPR
ncbi:uncharacterized protein LOC125220413 [Salvia hispanica]|uniref:uncharacterized protein LOC125220413 n=1 Tax=Salvia hispanica TaxID=49212 RepID=UPI0020092051|nr:uncharacterized protein LOC125220413 [Salvia hispanica]